MVLLLPVYQPGAYLSPLIDEVRAADPECPIVVVDDGSDHWPEGLDCTVLHHPVNRGKGAALKTGFAHIAAHHPGEDVICADSDGQHHAADVLRVAARVRETGHTVLGVRRICGEMPLRSWIGNAATRVLFRAVTGRAVRDTQTGLRGYPGSLLSWLGSVPGERFEYEMNVLLEAARAGHPIEQVEIATTYLDDNASSHFTPLADAARIYRPLLRFAMLRAGVSGGERR